MAGENTFTGFTSTAGFTDVVVTSADELRAQIQAQTVTQRRRYLLRWDGVSVLNFDSINGPAAAQYSPNIASDWGFDRPDHAVWIAPDAGFNPIIGALPNANIALAHQITWRGFNWLHFENVTFDCRTFITRTDFFPGLTILAATGCAWTDLDFDRIGERRALWVFPGRALHTQNCLFHNCIGGASGSVSFMRGWNDVFHEHGVQDVYNCSGFDYGPSSYGYELSQQNPRVWLFGATVYQSNTMTVASGLHTDFFQCHQPRDGQDNFKVLIEFNTAMLNSSEVLDQPQAQFIQADGIGRTPTNPGNLSMQTEWVMHNNIAAHAASNSITLQEPSDSTGKFIMNNTLARAATFSTESFPQVIGLREQVGSTGIWRVRGNVLAVTNAPFNRNDVGGNAIVDPRAGLGIDPAAFFTGNGTWTTNAAGRQSYVSPDAGAPDAATARAAIHAFFRPQGGWNDLSGTRHGATDPANWPTQPAAVIA
jgi:hypothetical protein